MWGLKLPSALKQAETKKVPSSSIPGFSKWFAKEMYTETELMKVAVDRVGRCFGEQNEWINQVMEDFSILEKMKDETRRVDFKDDAQKEAKRAQKQDVEHKKRRDNVQDKIRKVTNNIKAQLNSQTHTNNATADKSTSRKGNNVKETSAVSREGVETSGKALGKQKDDETQEKHDDTGKKGTPRLEKPMETDSRPSETVFKPMEMKSKPSEMAEITTNKTFASGPTKLEDELSREIKKEERSSGSLEEFTSSSISSLHAAPTSSSPKQASARSSFGSGGSNRASSATGATTTKEDKDAVFSEEKGTTRHAGDKIQEVENDSSFEAISKNIRKSFAVGKTHKNAEKEKMQDTETERRRQKALKESEWERKLFQEEDKRDREQIKEISHLIEEDSDDLLLSDLDDDVALGKLEKIELSDIRIPLKSADEGTSIPKASKKGVTPLNSRSPIKFAEMPSRSPLKVRSVKRKSSRKTINGKKSTGTPFSRSSRKRSTAITSPVSFSAKKRRVSSTNKRVTATFGRSMIDRAGPSPFVDEDPAVLRSENRLGEKKKFVLGVPPAVFVPEGVRADNEEPTIRIERSRLTIRSKRLAERKSAMRENVSGGINEKNGREGAEGREEREGRDEKEGRDEREERNDRDEKEERNDRDEKEEIHEMDKRNRINPENRERNDPIIEQMKQNENLSPVRKPQFQKHVYSSKRKKKELLQMENEQIQKMQSRKIPLTEQSLRPPTLDIGSSSTKSTENSFKRKKEMLLHLHMEQKLRRERHIVAEKNKNAALKSTERSFLANIAVGDSRMNSKMDQKSYEKDILGKIKVEPIEDPNLVPVVDDTSRLCTQYVAQWASASNLKTQLMKQSKINPTRIFGQVSKVDCNEIFGKRYYGSLNVKWQGDDGLSVREMDAYDRRMGWKQ
ncbi:hypothetical protein HII12_002045 [Brettanomyces bruxellensis]|uniref:Inner centromere protein ARK-binding domain-containing protein n=1 Tax=Dekkera bruxellensis TaxID=5007 RepID=A0A8H6EWX1_DEKBR|nr:hypothetical protein HII12_002045 [Brettanomyces bruxellensis]